MISSEWAAPNTTRPGFKLDDVKAGKYGHHLHFWDWKTRNIIKSIDLGENGMIPPRQRVSIAELEGCGPRRRYGPWPSSTG